MGRTNAPRSGSALSPPKHARALRSYRVPPARQSHADARIYRERKSMTEPANEEKKNENPERLARPEEVLPDAEGQS
jgi:hypothetical protein